MLCVYVTCSIGCMCSKRAGILVSIDFIVSVAAAAILNSLCQSNKREKLFANCAVSRAASSRSHPRTLLFSLFLLLIKISVIKFHDISAIYEIPNV